MKFFKSALITVSELSLALSLVGCDYQSTPADSGAQNLQLVFAGDAASSAFSSETLLEQATFDFIDKDTGLLNPAIQDSVLLTPYLDGLCTSVASGTLIAAQNPVQTQSGVAVAENLSYTLPGHLEERISIMASALAAGTSVCLPGVDITHQFTPGQGYLALSGSTGAAGAQGANKVDYILKTREDANGRYVNAGVSFNSSGGADLAIWRNNPDGTADDTFGGGSGMVVPYLNSPSVTGASAALESDYTNALQIDAEGRYLIGGYSLSPDDSGNNEYVAVFWRLLPSGIPDTSFGSGNGFVLSNTDGNSEIKAVAIDSQDRYLLSGYVTNSQGGEELAIWRYNNDGSADSSFGSGTGFIRFQPDQAGAAGASGSSKADVALSVMIDASNKITVSGQSREVSGGGDLVIWRFNSDGTSDPSFGTGAGFVVFQQGGLGAAGANDLSKDDGYGSELSIDSNGRYVVAGVSFTSLGGSELVVWRFNADGSLDSNFGMGAGYAVFNDGQTGACGEAANQRSDFMADFSLLGNGQILVAGACANPSGGTEPALWRFNTDGTPDATFGSGSGTIGFGHNLPSISGVPVDSKNEQWMSLTVDHLGRYALSGFTYDPDGSYEAVQWRYLPDGSIDQ